MPFRDFLLRNRQHTRLLPDFPAIDANESYGGCILPLAPALQSSTLTSATEADPAISSSHEHRSARCRNLGLTPGLEAQVSDDMCTYHSRFVQFLDACSRLWSHQHFLCKRMNFSSLSCHTFMIRSFFTIVTSILLGLASQAVKAEA